MTPLYLTLTKFAKANVEKAGCNFEFGFVTPVCMPAGIGGQGFVTLQRLWKAGWRFTVND